MALAGLLVTHAAALATARETLGDSLLRDSRVILENQGFGGITIRVNGRDIALHGTVNSPAARQRVLDLAAQVQGVRRVHDHLQSHAQTRVF